ncbi:MAG: hypothetical protein IT361_07270 [Gemmatimonadaceae bacterium]|nr:hypothetical protein [Gemmatimonadaceae bacterium]
MALQEEESRRCSARSHLLRVLQLRGSRGCGAFRHTRGHPELAGCPPAPVHDARLSLQNHFAALLKREQIPFDEQCRTEHGERPDFLVPGCAAYNDAMYPSDRMRMVACKSVLRERWDQMLNEAERIAEKYLLTLDLALTDATIEDIRRNNVRIFIPSMLADAAYRNHVRRSEIESVSELIKRLQASWT